MTTRRKSVRIIAFITSRQSRSLNRPQKKRRHECSNEGSASSYSVCIRRAGVNTGRNRRRMIPESGEGLIPVGTKFPLSQDRSVINVRTTWPANRRLSRVIVVTGGMIARISQVDIDRRNAPFGKALPWIYIANRSLINCRPRHEIAAEFRSIIIIVDCGLVRMRPMREGDTNHSFCESMKLCSNTRLLAHNLHLIFEAYLYFFQKKYFFCRYIYNFHKKYQIINYNISFHKWIIVKYFL